MTEQAISERVGVSQVAQITGMGVRTIQQRAAWGLIPSAAKLGGNWSFDEAAIRLWVGQQELVTAKKKILFFGPTLARHSDARQCSPCPLLANNGH